MQKYEIGDDHEWPDEQEQQKEDFTDQPVMIKSHDVDIVHTVDPSEDGNYGRVKYSTHIVDEQDGASAPYVLYATKYRWKGNFWRESVEIDWRDVPNVVQRRVASVIVCDGPDDLRSSERLIETGGRSAWNSHHHDDDGDDDDSSAVTDGDIDV